MNFGKMMSGAAMGGIAGGAGGYFGAPRGWDSEFGTGGAVGGGILGGLIGAKISRSPGLFARARNRVSKFGAKMSSNQPLNSAMSP